jgi:preprotein translocase subunit SecG
MYTVLVIVQVLAAVSLIGLILLQQGKGADAGAAFGSGASSTVFGSRGAANFLSRTTAWLAAVFFAVSLALAYLVHGRATTGSIIDKMATTPATPAVTLPVMPAPAAGTPVLAVPPEVGGAKPDGKTGTTNPAAPAPAKVPE